MFIASFVSHSGDRVYMYVVASAIVVAKTAAGSLCCVRTMILSRKINRTSSAEAGENVAV